ncbi:hypothetical protein K503DRAFT_773854 [Rhizopogon vinicolor AM-OR11-026]|uniref:Uncharacterized protein n=1 Tax=Rhizopogon vinicolor AM-OR11-026 TaxID=1314800 RepID=A0A1B7MR39_9AGAM|nr:hypothetical protein K503DRAFT_773854 [Rhizopogon vinicolor AM-OR11-026]
MRQRPIRQCSSAHDSVYLAVCCISRLLCILVIAAAGPAVKHNEGFGEHAQFTRRA